MNIKFEAKTVEEKKKYVKEVGLVHLNDEEVLIWDGVRKEWSYAKGWGVTVIEEREVDMLLEGRNI